MKSILGRLVEEEFGRKQYQLYIKKLQKKESMDIFCDIYLNLRNQSEEQLNHALVKLLNCIQSSIDISRKFFYVTFAYVTAVLALYFIQAAAVPKIIGAAILSVAYIVKFIEYISNRYCDRDVRIVLIYKIALFHLLEEHGRERRHGS